MEQKALLCHWRRVPVGLPGSRAVLGCLLVILGSLSLCWGEEKTQPEVGKELTKAQQKMALVNQNLDRLKVKLRGMTQQSAKLSDEIDEMELRRAVVSGKIRLLNLELEQAEEEMARNRAMRSELEEKAEAQQELLAQRLRELYKKGKLGYAQILLKQSRVGELITAYHYARHLSEKDKAAIESFQMTLDQLEAVQKALALARDKAEETKLSLKSEKSELDALLKERSRRLAKIRKQRSKSRKLFAELALQKEELNMLVKRLTAEDHEDPSKYRLPITRYKGKLEWPVRGPIKRRFGIYTDPEFKTKRRQKGIDIGVAPGEEVKAIYSGKVIFADWFKSYGNLIIIDHGNRITSFYAHNQSLQVNKGDFVERGQVVATSGDTGSLEGPFLHFEVRNKAIPENPLKWLK